MLAILAMLTILSACVIASLTYTGTVSRNVVASNSNRRAIEIGDGALGYMFAHWRELCKESPNALLSTDKFANIPAPTAAMFPALSSYVSNYTVSTSPNPEKPATPKYTIANYQVQAVNPQMSPMPVSTVPEVGTGMQTGTNTAFYLASADVSLPAFGNRWVTAKMRRVFAKEQKSPWEYAIFYNDLLEIHPGAKQTIAGWVHTNGSLYTAHDTLTFASKVDYGNDWGVAFAPGDKDHTETPTSPHYPSNLPPARGQVQLPFGMDPTQVFTGSNSNNTSYHELIEPPVVGQPDPISASRYYDQAQIRVLVDGSNNVTMTDINNNSINSTTAALTGTNNPSVATRALYMLFNDAIATNQTFQDNREGATMRVVTFDVSQLTSALTSPADGGTGYLLGYNLGKWPQPGGLVSDSTHSVGNVAWNGIVYIGDTSGSSSTKRGVRLKNGATIKGPGLTVASMNPVYIQGDYNTGRTASSETPANSKNDGTGSNVVPGYTELPCAVLGDAVNILSNSWKDSNSSASLSSRTASPTTVNTAIVSGIVPTGSGGTGANSYSGGAENFPRFLESWSNKTFTYYGSMVELFKSQQSIGYWGSGNVYDPPNRNWNFDPLFYTQPPPGSLLIVTYSQQRWFIQ